MSNKIDFRQEGWQDAHRDMYLRTNGEQGQFMDFTMAGGPERTPCLLLRTTGRKSGEAKTLPLIYGEDHGHYIIIASKGGAPAHPAWYLNLDSNPEVAVQVGSRKVRAKASTVHGAERQRLYDMMSKIYPPYIDYQKRTDREIPVVVLEPEGELERI